MTAHLELLSIGDVDIDIFLRVPRLPRAGEKVRGRLVGFRPGGVAANVAVAGRRLGLRTGVHGIVGDDVHGQLTRTSLEREDVDVTSLVTDPAHPTFLCVVHLDDRGDKALTLAETPAIFPTHAQLDRSALGRSDRVHIAPFDLDVAADAAQSAAAAGASVSVDLEPGSIGTGLDDVADLLANVDVCFVNHHAAQLLADDEDVTRCLAPLHALGPHLVLVTSGAEGALVSDGTRLEQVPAVPVTPVDTTGAGDAFCAAVLHGLTRGHDLLTAVRAGVHAGALACRDVGAQASAPTAAELQASLRQRPEAIGTAAALPEQPSATDLTNHGDPER
jgi:ribokinase